MWISVSICIEALVSGLQGLDTNQSTVACNHFIPVCVHSLLQHNHICVLKGSVYTHTFVLVASVRTIEILSSWAEIQFLQTEKCIASVPGVNRICNPRAQQSMVRKNGCERVLECFPSVENWEFSRSIQFFTCGCSVKYLEPWYFYWRQTRPHVWKRAALSTCLHTIEQRCCWSKRCCVSMNFNSCLSHTKCEGRKLCCHLLYVEPLSSLSTVIKSTRAFFSYILIS